MSDDEYQYDYEDDDGGAFGGDDDDAGDGQEDLNVKIQNAFYMAKGNKESDPAAAMEGFKEVISIAEEAGR
jgi:hypothetical protein